jgi:hypothetical protein
MKLLFTIFKVQMANFEALLNLEKFMQVFDNDVVDDMAMRL